MLWFEKTEAVANIQNVSKLLLHEVYQKYSDLGNIFPSFYLTQIII
jgi:hypothetical protein